MTITKAPLAGMIDHSLLRPRTTRKKLKRLCEEDIQYRFKAVCVNPIHVADAVLILKESDVLVYSVAVSPSEICEP